MDFNFGENLLQGIQSATNTAAGAVVSSVGEKLSELIGGKKEAQGGNQTAEQIAQGNYGSPPQSLMPGSSFMIPPELKWVAIAGAAYIAYRLFKKR